MTHDTTDALVGERVAAGTLVALREMTPVRLRRLVTHFGDVSRALRAVQQGAPAVAAALEDDDARAIAARWRRTADPRRAERMLDRRRTHVWVEGTEAFPFTKPAPNQPYVLLGEGVVADAFERPRVAVIGTRSATPHGLADAAELGAYLAEAGITVVSGLAIGIDGAAHEGAVRAGGRAIGVVATGLDIEYPRRHRGLYERVRAQGAVVSECWYGTPPERWRFPVRNRIIAALADAVVVVEATLTGGSRHTARDAVDYDRPVLAMPGSRRNAAAAGCNALIADGAQPLIEPSDVIVALELAAGGRVQWKPPPKAKPTRDERSVLRALAGEPATLDELIVRTGLDTVTTATAVRALERAGVLQRQRGYLWPA